MRLSLDKLKFIKVIFEIIKTDLLKNLFLKIIYDILLKSYYPLYHFLEQKDNLQ